MARRGPSSGTRIGFRPAFSLTHDDVYTTSVHPRFFFDNSPEPPPLAPHATLPPLLLSRHTPFFRRKSFEASRQASLSLWFSTLVVSAYAKPLAGPRPVLRRAFANI